MFGLVLTQLILIIWAYGLFYGSLNLVQLHAYVFNTTSGIFYVLLMYCLCTKPDAVEVFGVVLASAGCASLMLDP